MVATKSGCRPCWVAQHPDVGWFPNNSNWTYDTTSHGIPCNFFDTRRWPSAHDDNDLNFLFDDLMAIFSSEITSFIDSWTNLSMLTSRHWCYNNVSHFSCTNKKGLLIIVWETSALGPSITKRQKGSEHAYERYRNIIIDNLSCREGLHHCCH